MILNIYRVMDSVRKREVRIFFSETDGAACRDQISFDLRSEKNPSGLPFQDIEYWRIGRYDTENGQFFNDEPVKIDIEHAYSFRHPEVEMKKEEIDPSKLDKMVKE